jgi:hypothetical protein
VPGRSLDRDVTSAQRARLVVALGVLNLVLASLAFAVGIGAPRLPAGEVAAVSLVPSAAAPSSLARGEPRPTPPLEPSPSVARPLETPASPGPSATVEPSTIPVPTGAIIVAARPTERPTPAPARPTPGATSPASTPAATNPASTPAPTAKPKPTNPPHATPAVKPPPKPTPPPKPAVKPKAHPPCPSAIDGPPGHSKGQPGHEPCGKGKSKESKGGVIVVLPVALTAAAATGRRRISRSLRRSPFAR